MHIDDRPAALAPPTELSLTFCHVLSTFQELTSEGVRQQEAILLQEFCRELAPPEVDSGQYRAMVEQ